MPPRRKLILDRRLHTHSCQVPIILYEQKMYCIKPYYNLSYINLKKKKKKSLNLECEVERYFLLVSSFYIFLPLCYPFITQCDFLMQFVCSVLLIKTCRTKGKEEGIANCLRLLLLST